MNTFLSPDDPTLTERERALVRVGREAIATGDETALDAYYADNFKFHGPDEDSSNPELKAFFASWRRTFADFACERRHVMSHGDYVSARTAMSGTFHQRLEASPVGPIEPNGSSMVLELINLFRYDADGKLAEEWVQYDNASLLKQLGITLSSA